MTILEELLKDHWTPIINWGYHSIMLGKFGKRLIYDVETDSVTVRYDTEIRRRYPNSKE